MHVDNFWVAHELEYTGHYYVINIKTNLTSVATQLIVLHTYMPIVAMVTETT